MFTLVNRDLRMGREEWLDKHLDRLLRQVSQGRSNDRKKELLRMAALEAVDQGVYSQKSPTSEVEMALVKKMRAANPDYSWVELCRRVAPHFLP